MKKYVLLFLVALMPLFAMAQAENYESIKKGENPFMVFVFDKNYNLSIDSIPHQDYYVINFPNKTAKELYDMVRSHVVDFYEQPDKVTSGMEGVSIVINGYEDRLVHYYYEKTLEYSGSINYRLQFKFKDGKIRVEIPTITSFKEYDWSTRLTKTETHPDAIRIKFMMYKDICEPVEERLSILANYMVYGDPNKKNDDW